jgi:hypothetical protein
MKSAFRTHLWRSCTMLALLACCALVAQPATALAQGVTTGSLTGRVTDAQQQPVVGAKVIATHLPSGTNYETTTRADGRYSIPGMRVGGGYLVTVSFAGQDNRLNNITVDGSYFNNSFGLSNSPATARASRRSRWRPSSRSRSTSRRSTCGRATSSARA